MLLFVKALNLVKSKILLFGKGFTQYHLIPSFKEPEVIL